MCVLVNEIYEIIMGIFVRCYSCYNKYIFNTYFTYEPDQPRVGRDFLEMKLIDKLQTGEKCGYV